MVRPDIAKRKITRATSWLEQSEALASVPAEEFLANAQKRDLASFYLFLAIQESMDLALHWVADSGVTPPDDVGSAFDILADQGAIDRDLASRMRGAVGLRNRIAHGYAALDHGRLHSEFNSGVAAVRRFLSCVGETAGL